jgi:hypothetical protein
MLTGPLRAQLSLLALLLPLGLVTTACIQDSGASGNLGLVYGQDFTVSSGSAFQSGDSLEIVLSDEPGEGCFGLGDPPPVGNRQVRLTAPEATVGTWSTSQGAQISAQRLNEGGVYDARAAEGSLTLTDVLLSEDGEVSGAVQGTTPEGDEIQGRFFVPFCP